MSKIKPIYELVDELPTDNITTKALHALDFVVPGQWENLVGFETTISKVSGETDQQMIQKIGERAIALYSDSSQGYQRAMWLYQTIDRTDQALGAAALANKVGEQISFLGFLKNITPKADTAQTIDLSMKLVVELLAFCQINGLPGDSIGDFVASLADYSGESLMRMAALVCFDGLIPLGPDFLNLTLSSIKGMLPEQLQENDTFREVRGYVPGDSTADQLQFVQRSMDSVEGWMRSFTQQRDLTPEKVINNLQGWVQIADDKLDYLGAFLDMTTNYFEHTGTQTLANRLIRRAMSEI